jgi:hypothetical protein
MRSRIAQLLILVVAVGLLASPSLAGEAEFIQNGDFELGLIGLDIARSPRYPKQEVVEFPTLERSGGETFLRLPPLPPQDDSLYEIIFQTMPLVAGREYTFSVRARGDKGGRLSVVVYSSSGTPVFRQRIDLKRKMRTFTYSFRADSVSPFNEDQVAHFLRMHVVAPSDVWLDDVSLTGPAGGVLPPASRRIWIEPADRVMTVYDQSHPGEYLISSLDKGTAVYEISDPRLGLVLDTGSVPLTFDEHGIGSGRIPLSTDRRGFFLITAGLRSSDGRIIDSVSRTYAVINFDPGPAQGKELFGLCMEEHGKTTSNAFIQPREYYRLASALGAGTVRIFSLGMPGILSEDGEHYDFTQIDAALDLLLPLGLEPFIPLGSNNPSSIPEWMRSKTAKGPSINLHQGLRTKKLKRQVAGQGDNHFVNLDAYQTYLERLFLHLKGRVEYFEIWNEPGHKFTVEDTLKLARVTDAARRKAYPEAKIVGYSSTKGPGTGQGMDPAALPAYLNEVLKKGGGRYIDVLSFHSGHAYKFMGNTFDWRDPEIGFVKRLKAMLARESMSGMEIWDTERGIKWTSFFPERIDFKSGSTPEANDIDAETMETVFAAARNLPMIYAASAAQGVQRLFWFNLIGAVNHIARTQGRWSFFDGQLEAMPHLVAYDAMTEMLAGTTFDSLNALPAGTRIYLFSSETGTVALVHNWREKQAEITFKVPRGTVEIRDLYGNVIRTEKGQDRIAIEAEQWPRYVVFHSVKPADVALEGFTGE